MKAFNILSNVGNIDEWLCSNIEELPCSLGTYYLCQVINPDNELSDTYVATENGKYTFFEGAYVVYKGETINITSLIEELDGANVIYDNGIANYLEDIGTIDFYLDLEGEEINIMLVKNGIYYMGTTVIDGLVE